MHDVLLYDVLPCDVYNVMQTKDYAMYWFMMVLIVTGGNVYRNVLVVHDG